MAVSWDQHISKGSLRVKGGRASVHQAQMMHLIVSDTKKRGGDTESQAGAVATAIQESGCTNISGGDRDSQGLYQQRPSMGWGSVAQIRTPSYAVKKFLDQFLAYRRKGQGWLTASHNTQRSAFASAPAKWYGEGLTAARYFAGAGADTTPAGGTGGGVSGSTSTETSTETRTLPYEFSRGTPDKKENSWEASGRLADEVSWRRWMRRGELWLASEDWLKAQPPKYSLSDLSPGVIDLSFDWETRLSKPAEATLKVQALRYELAPGDTLDLKEMGPGNGRWIIASTRRVIGQPIVDVSLKRPIKRGLEPAAQTETKTSVKVGAAVQSTGNGAVNISHAGDERAKKAYEAAEQISRANLPYIWGGGHGADFHQGLARGYDCSGSTSWALAKAGIPLPAGARFGVGGAVSGAFERWGQDGMGKYFTVCANGEHVWIRWNGIGPAWRFDTSSYGSGGNGPKQRSGPRPLTGFKLRHWAGL